MMEQMTEFMFAAKCGHRVAISIAESVDPRINSSIASVVASHVCWSCQQKTSVLAGAIKTLSDDLQADPELAWGWHCNIAMPIHDCGVEIEIANDAAERVMQQLFGVDTSQLRKERRASA
jgi:hypothetical protein